VAEILQHEPVVEETRPLATEALKRLQASPLALESSLSLLNFLNVYCCALSLVEKSFSTEVMSDMKRALCAFREEGKSLEKSPREIEGWLFLALQIASRENFSFPPLEPRRPSPLLQGRFPLYTPTSLAWSCILLFLLLSFQ
jgi:hypothetical protein